MTTFFVDGGFLMIPLLLTGFALTALATLFALRPEPRRLSTVKACGLALTSLGLLGFVNAVVATLRGSQQAPDATTQAQILVAGLAESSNNLILMLAFVVIASVASTVGVARSRA